MTLSFTITLLVVVGVLLVLRLTIRRLPVATWGRPIRRWDAGLGALSALGLVSHCVAMFNAPLISGLPGADTYISMVNQMGPGSVAFYVVPAVLLLLGLRGQRRVVLTVLGLSLLAVGITMYDNGRLDTHLAALFVAVVLIAATATLLITKVVVHPGERLSASGTPRRRDG